MKKNTKEKFESNLDNMLLENSPNSKTYWKIMKSLLRSSKANSCIPPLRNIINDSGIDNII